MVQRSLLALVVALFVGCGQSEPEPPSPGDPVSAVASRDGVQVVLTIDHTPATAGERVWARVTVDNGSSDVILYRGGGCDFPADVTVVVAEKVRPDAGRAWDGMAGQFKGLLAPVSDPTDLAFFIPEAFVDRGPMGCTADLGVNELQPGGHLELRAAWDGDIALVLAPAGPAVLTASFPMLGPKSAVVDPFGNPNPIKAALVLDVVLGGITSISGATAVDAALGDPRFAAWVGDSVIDQWQGVDLGVTRDAYTVTLERSDGGGVKAGRVRVDRRTGAVLSFVLEPSR
jgi:hypothetical protein